MSEYVATFYTHYAAMQTFRALKDKGAQSVMEPVPRALSASCGSCVRYIAPDAMEGCMHVDYQAIYSVTDGGYMQVKLNDKA